MALAALVSLPGGLLVSILSSAVKVSRISGSSFFQSRIARLGRTR